jgi:hypothetical protein
MISDVDIKDWDQINPQKAQERLDSLGQALGSAVFFEEYIYLTKFILNVELLRRKQVQQVPALFKEKNG